MNNLSQRLNYALELKGVKKADLAKLVGMTPQAVQYLCSSDAQTSRFTFEIATALGISFKWLATGEGSMESAVFKKISSTQEIPVRSLQEVRDHFVHHAPYSNPPTEHVVIATPHEKVLAVKLSDNAMSPRLDKGSIVICVETTDIKDKEYALVYVHDIEEVLFREVFIDNGVYSLVPFNGKVFNTIKMQSNDRILGKLVEARWS